MHLPQASLLLAAFMGAVVNAVSVVEMDLVFPRNETYSPTEDFPVIFAIQSPQKAHLLNPRFSYRITRWNHSEWFTSTSHTPKDLDLSTSDPYLSYRFFSGLTPGHWFLAWQLRYQSCDVVALSDPSGPGGVFTKTYGWSRMFTIANSTSAPDKEVDLVAATKEGSCPEDRNAFAINVTDTVMESPALLNSAGRSTCVVETNSTSGTPVHTPNPCGVSISPEMAANLSADLTALKCSRPNPPDNCPVEESAAAQGVRILAVSGLFATLGAFTFIMMQSC